MKFHSQLCYFFLWGCLVINSEGNYSSDDMEKHNQQKNDKIFLRTNIFHVGLQGDRNIFHIYRVLSF
ncbi:MAG: hypothetical protein RLZZ29_1767 [Cyanobacteriota bacterium]